MNSVTRYQSFRSEMILKGVKWTDIAKLLGISKQGSIMAIQRETIKKEYHEKLLEQGFSENVLPKPNIK